MRKTMTRDKRTGRMRRINVKASFSARKAARKRRGRHLSMMTKMKMRRSMTITRRTHRTRSGRRVVISVKHRR